MFLKQEGILPAHLLCTKVHSSLCLQTAGVTYQVLDLPSLHNHVSQFFQTDRYLPTSIGTFYWSCFSGEPQYTFPQGWCASYQLIISQPPTHPSFLFIVMLELNELCVPFPWATCLNVLLFSRGLWKTLKQQWKEGTFLLESTSSSFSLS